MTATGHAVIGAIIAAKFGNPYVAIPLAFLSHFAADWFPHWDTATEFRKKGVKRVFIESFVDVCLGFSLSYFILTTLFPQTNLVYGFVIILVSQSPDWLMAPYFFFKIKIPPFTWAYRMQLPFDNSLKAPWGILTQVTVLILFLYLATTL